MPDSPRARTLSPRVNREAGIDVVSPTVKVSQIRLMPKIKKAKAPIAMTRAKIKTKRKKTKVKSAATIKSGIAKGAAKMDRIAIWTMFLVFFDELLS